MDVYRECVSGKTENVYQNNVHMSLDLNLSTLFDH